MEAIGERFHVWCPEKGLPGDEPRPLFFQAKQRIEDVSTKVDVFGKHCMGGEGAVSFEEVLDQAIAMLQRRGRVTYGTLQRQFALDADALADLKDALLYAHPQVVDDPGRGLRWTGESAATPVGSPAIPLGQNTRTRLLKRS